MRKGFQLSVGLACLVAMAAGGDAFAKSRKTPPGYAIAHNQDESFNRSLSLNPSVAGSGRSWLDPGTAVPVGSTNRYMLQQTYYNRDPVQTAQPSWYMGETLPQRMPQNVIVPYEEGLPFAWP